MTRIDEIRERLEKATREVFDVTAPDDIRFLLDEVERLTKGLEFYASKENNDWNIDGFDEVLPSKVMQDDGEIARQTLKGASL